MIEWELEPIVRASVLVAITVNEGEPSRMRNARACACMHTHKHRRASDAIYLYCFGLCGRRKGERQEETDEKPNEMQRRQKEQEKKKMIHYAARPSFPLRSNHICVHTRTSGRSTELRIESSVSCVVGLRLFRTNKTAFERVCWFPFVPARK